MKYFIRSIKYLFYFIILCSLMMVIVFYTSQKEEGTTLLDLLKQGNFMYKAGAFFIAVAAVYPLLGFQKKEIYVSNFKDNKKEIENLFANANYIIAEDNGTTIKFILRNKLLRIFKMYEDAVTIDYSNNPVIIEGLRKDVFKFSRGIEYLCQKNNDQEEIG